MAADIYTKPRWFFTVTLPLTREVNPQWWFRRRKCSVGYFGPSSATNTTWRLVFFGWVLCELQRHEWHDESQKERADRYLAEWSKCEKELQMFRLAKLGEDAAPEVKRVIKESLGIDLDEGTVR